MAHPLGATGHHTGKNNDTDGDNNNDAQNKIINRILDPLHPSSLPGGVRDAWSSLSRYARPLNVLGGEVDDLEKDTTGGIDGTSLSSAIDQGQVITASMIERELANEKRHENEEYTLTTGQLSVACRTVALNKVVQRESELVNLLERDVVGSGKVLERAKKEIQDATASYAAGGAAEEQGNMELMNSFYSRLNEVKEYHTQNNNNTGGETKDIFDASSYPTYTVSLASFPNMPSDSALGIGLQQPNQQLRNPLPSLLQMSGQKRKHGHPLADGYDIASLIATETAAVRSGEVYTPEELFGKYLDLVQIYESEVRNMRHAFAHNVVGGGSDDDSKNNNNNNNGGRISMISYLDFLSILSKGLNTSIPEVSKLRDRKKYVRFLYELQKYLTGFLKRTSPFLKVESDVIAKAIALFDKEWREKGGVDGWECRMAEASMVSSDENTNIGGGGGESASQAADVVVGIDLSKYATSSDLERNVSGDELKSELSRLGLKCGGTVSDRAARLFLTKDTPLDQLPAKVFAKKKGGTGGGGGAKKAKIDAAGTTSVAGQMNGTSSNNASELIAGDRRVDIARLEAIVTSLLDQLRPTLEGTRRLIERRTTQTENERDQEIDEEINGTPDDKEDATKKQASGGNNAGSDDEDDEDDAPIYNPKNVPLGWDGKPIPYWLFKLHGLNHFYPCEICGNESYRGRRNFEKHFTESRHAYGMRCLGIPNTKHFHGVTKITDAQELWGKLKHVLEGNQFDVDQEEEYEDSHGNIVNRAQYEDLARQGLL